MTTIILTSTVNTRQGKSWVFQREPTLRIETYLKSILQWLTKTNFNIVLVENSGYHYDELNNEKEIYKNRFEVITFNEIDLEEAQYLEGNNSKGASEIFAINYAYLHSNLINSSNFIIKITARFFIDELEQYLGLFDLNDYDCLTQHNRDRCEMVGSHYKHFLDIFNVRLINDQNQYDGHIENIWKLRTSKYKKILICKMFNINETQRGGVEEKYTTI
jgi:hypothetical protein